MKIILAIVAVVESRPNLHELPKAGTTAEWSLLLLVSPDHAHRSQPKPLLNASASADGQVFPRTGESEVLS